MNWNRLLNFSIGIVLLGIVVSLVTIFKSPPQDPFGIALWLLFGRGLVILLVVLLGTKLALFLANNLADGYQSLPPEERANVRQYGKRTIRVVANRLKKNERCREAVEEVEEVLRE